MEKNYLRLAETFEILQQNEHKVWETDRKEIEKLKRDNANLAAIVKGVMKNLKRDIRTIRKARECIMQMAEGRIEFSKIEKTIKMIDKETGSDYYPMDDRAARIGASRDAWQKFRLRLSGLE